MRFSGGGNGTLNCRETAMAASLTCRPSRSSDSESSALSSTGMNAEGRSTLPGQVHAPACGPRVVSTVYRGFSRNARNLVARMPRRAIYDLDKMPIVKCFAPKNQNTATPATVFSDLRIELRSFLQGNRRHGWP